MFISLNNHSYLGEIYLKIPNQDNNENSSINRLQQRQQISLLDPFDNHDGVFRSNQVRSMYSKYIFLNSFQLFDFYLYIKF